MEDSNYPGLYQASNKASLDNQKNYTFLMGTNLVFLVIVTLLTFIKLQFSEIALCTNIASSILLFLGFIITIVIKIKKFEDVWYQGRALAESVKTLSWRYMTKSESFDNKLTNEQSNEIFLEKIDELKIKFNSYIQHFDSKIILLPSVTDFMMETREKKLENRKKIYEIARIEEQKRWYSSKAEFNGTKNNQWFVVILIAQIVAIGFSVLLIVSPDTLWNLVGLCTTIASVGIAWNQLKQHQDRKQAYNTAAFELQLIKEKMKNIITEDDFSKYVLDSENAISREHTLWLVQKRK